jgi:EmrB/QacA subfamily drug resistance transporter
MHSPVHRPLLAWLQVQSTPHSLRKGPILALTCLAQFMVILDISVVNIALPSIRSDLGFSAVDLQWVVNAYTLTFAGFLLLGGRAADLLGRQQVFVAGLVLFAAASLAGGLSSSQEMLVAARAVQGIGGAVVAPATLAIITTTFPEGRERNRALAYWGAMGAVGGSTGVLLGGVLTELLGWQWILFINIPVGVLGALAAMRFIPASTRTPAGDRHFDVAGALSVTAGLVLVTFAIVRTDVNGWGSAATLLVAAAGLALLALFVVIERRATRPLVPLRIFASRTLTAANLVVFTLGASAFAMWYFVSLYLQQVLGFSPIEAGLSFLPMTGAIVVASTFAGRMAQRFGPGKLLVAGMTLIGIGMLVFTRISPTGSYAGDVLVPGVVTTAGIGLAFVPATIAAVAGVARSDAGLAGGLVNTSRQVGGSIGLAVLATVATQRTDALARSGGVDASALTAGYHRAFLVGALFALAGAVIAAGLLVRVRQPSPAAAQEPTPVDA